MDGSLIRWRDAAVTGHLQSRLRGYRDRSPGFPQHPFARAIVHNDLRIVMPIYKHATRSVEAG